MQQRYLCMCYPGASEVKKKVLKLECEDKVKTQQQQNRMNTNLNTSEQPPKDSRNT